MSQPDDDFTDTAAEEHDIVSADEDARDRLDDADDRPGVGLLPILNPDTVDQATDDEPNPNDATA